MKQLTLILSLILGFNLSPSKAQDGIAPGTSLSSWHYSFDYFNLDFVDDYRTTLDSIVGINGMSDYEYIQLRDSVSKSTWGRSFGYEFTHNINEKIGFSTGIKYVEAKQLMNPSELNDTLLPDYFTVQSNKNRYKTQYNFIEVPLEFKFNFSGKTPYTGKAWRQGSFFTLGAGLAFSVTTHQNTYFNEIENSKIIKNVGLNGLLSLNFHKEINDEWFFEVGTNFRTNVINNYVYAPVKSRYTSYGANVKFGRTLVGAPLKFKSRSVLECMDFKGERNFELGIAAGLNTTLLQGNDRKSDYITNNNLGNLNPDNLVGVKKQVLPVYGLYLGLYSTFHLKGPLSLQFTPSYSHKGMHWNYDYVLNYGGAENYKQYTRLKVNFYHFDLPLLINYKRGKHVFSAGILNSVSFTDRIFEYSTGDSFTNNSPVGYTSYTLKNRVLNYFGVKHKDYLSGYIIGYQREFDKWAAWSIQVQQNSQVFDKDKIDLQLKFLTIKTGVIFFLYRKLK